jgi:hypothetical protein
MIPRLITSWSKKKSVYVHSSLRLLTRKAPEYLQGPAAQWDVDPKDASQIDDEVDGPSLKARLVNVPLDDIELQLQGIDDDERKEVRLMHFWIVSMQKIQIYE